MRNRICLVAGIVSLYALNIIPRCSDMIGPCPHYTYHDENIYTMHSPKFDSSHLNALSASIDSMFYQKNQQRILLQKTTIHDSLKHYFSN